jgi:dihydroneopterin aldolase
MTGCDCVRLKEVVLNAHVGCTEEERLVTSSIVIDVDMWADLEPAARSDDITAAVDYRRAYEVIASVGSSREFNLLEALAGRVAGELMKTFDLHMVTVRARKPNPPVGGIVGWAEVEITRRRSAPSSRGNPGRGRRADDS